MTKAIRWRIMTLQAVMVLVLAFAAGFAFSESSFVNGTIRDELVSQKISFPTADQIKAGGALDPAVFPAEIQKYAGQPVDNGDKARVYANDFIAIHLKGVFNGMTYSEASAYSRAHPTDTQAAAAVQTLFRGETLRGLLLNAYGWSQVAMYTAWGGIVLSLAALVVFVAFSFEAIRGIQAYRKESEKVITGKPSPIPA